MTDVILTEEQEEERLSLQAEALVNGFDDLCVGKSTRVILFAVGFMLGRVAAQSVNKLDMAMEVAHAAATCGYDDWHASEPKN